MGQILVIDAGTSGVRAVVVDRHGQVRTERRREVPPQSPAPGRVEFDAGALWRAAVAAAREALAQAGPVAAVGLANQRASTVVWDAATGEPVAPAQGWQDTRVAPRCVALQKQGIALLPSQSAAKLADILDEVDPGRRRNLRFGTVDSWLAWQLSEGALHVSDASNAAATGLFRGGRPDPQVLEALGIPAVLLPRVVDSCGVLAPARALPGGPPLAALIGDQQASLLGQGCVHAGQAKLTLGTGGMLDLLLGDEPAEPPMGAHGTFGIVAWAREGRRTHGLEAIMLGAGANVAWLCDGLELLETPQHSGEVAASCRDSGGVVYVPALVGLGTPWWEFSARGGFFGLTRGTNRAQLVRAVLEGVAQRGADLVEAAQADSGRTIPILRVDGGMSRNETFVQLLADCLARPVEVSRESEATALGAAYLAGLAVGLWTSLEEVGGLWQPQYCVKPGRSVDRQAWREAVARVRGG